FFFNSYLHHRDLHSFPTRRSSDLRGDERDENALHNFHQRSLGPTVGETPDNYRAQFVPSPQTRGPMTVERVKMPTQSVPAEFLRSEEHTSELQSRGHLVCRLLLEK